jgi:hypothetical protein
MANHTLKLAPLTVVLLIVLSAHTVAASDLSGCWSGSWRSCTTGHNGPLNASFCRLNDCQYRVDFSGRFFKLLPFRYSVTLNVVSDDGETVQLAGSSYLGRLFGTFHYRAEATACKFTANYSSCDDRGVFVISRCCGGH